MVTFRMSMEFTQKAVTNYLPMALLIEPYHNSTIPNHMSLHHVDNV